ncbi:lysophospholipid acyltransferase family protein [Chondromyces apiculatus]|uniref:1-acyl-sn-glycerol-3-phosphate acyltransferase n=1 Tax=Chondromyces apiculatus DSM 436 TaxID=1192034 RepID=A0A017TEC5_9BACT|nr:lysophospholipid acyltransferase family protein [Chondromyces apiculatus]EYF07569.1 1-acyl-sn-glycerol-3-phosphate acyltransferase [Chondromyces apiculatus DSM 436]
MPTLMDLKEAWRATRQWVPFVARTVGYGSISLSLGPLTRDHRASLWAMQRWCQSSARGLNIDVHVSGLENVPTSGAFLYCANHQSLLDILVLGSVLPNDYKWAAKRELMKIPFLGWHLQLAGHVPVDRSGGSRAAAQVIGRFEQVLKEGKPLLIFPEGTRSEDGILRPFKSGGFYAAVRAGVPVVPVALEGTHKLMKKGAPDTGDGRMRDVYVRVGAPLQIRAEGKEAVSVADIRDRAHAAVLDLHLSLGGTPPKAAPTGVELPTSAAAEAVAES